MFNQVLLYCYKFYYLIALCLLHMHFKISTYNDSIVLCFQVKLVRMFQKFHSFLELGVSGFWQLFSNHMLSLESVLGFRYGIAK